MNEGAIRSAIAEHLGVPVEQVVDDADFRALGADSLDLIEMTLLLEQQFDVQIPDDDAHRCTTVHEAISLVRVAKAVNRVAVSVTTAVGA